MLQCGCDRVMQTEITGYNDSWLDTLLNNRKHVSYNDRMQSVHAMKIFAVLFNAKERIRRIIKTCFIYELYYSHSI